MRRGLGTLGRILAAVGIALAATGVLILTRPDRSITLLIYLPGITVVDALFGLWGGITAVGLSVAGSAICRMVFVNHPLSAPMGFYATWEEEMILLVVGVLVVALMELLRRSGERRASSAQQMATLLENVADAVVIFGRDMRVISMNPAAQAMLDRPGETVVGESAEELRRRFQFTSDTGAPPDEAPGLEELTRAGIAVHEQGTILDVSRNRRIHVLVSATPWRNAKNQMEGSLVLITDVTALKELQLRTLDNARHVAIAQMISGLTHDFNHVLDIVRRAVVVLELHEEAPAEERRKYREMIDRAAQDGATIVRRLRDYLAGGTGVMAPVDLAAVAREAVELTRPLWRGRAEVEVDEEIRPVPAVEGNANDLRRVLTNLIFNAVEALGAPGGRVTVHTEPTPANTVLAWVEDNGPGIPAEAQKRLFQPFYTTKPRGMGMGLFGAQRIILAHGGSLNFTSPGGRGARFTIELRAAREGASRRDAA